MQVVIPMAGLGSRFSTYGFTTNKYLLPLDTELTPMIELAITSLCLKNCKYIFIIRDETVKDILFPLCKKHNIEYTVLVIDELTEGPASTVYCARHLIDPCLPLIVSNSDQVLSWDSEKFLKTCEIYDGTILTYTPDYEITLGSVDKHSFARIDDDTVVECAEKIVLSDKALVGVHYFKRASTFFESYEYMKSKNMRAPNGEFYLSLVYQAMIENGKSVGYHQLINPEYFQPTGEPQDYFKYLYKYGGYLSNKEYRLPWLSFETEDIVILNKGLVLFLEGDYKITNKKYIQLEKPTKYLSIPCENNMEEQEWDVESFVRGWFVGNFEPTLFRTTEFEVGINKHKKGKFCAYHYHKITPEYNILLEGSVTINDKIIQRGEIFTIPIMQISCPIFHEDCKILCIKIGSEPSDKYII